MIDAHVHLEKGAYTMFVLKRSRKIYMIAVSYNCNPKICRSRTISTVRERFFFSGGECVILTPVTKR